MEGHRSSSAQIAISSEVVGDCFKVGAARQIMFFPAKTRYDE